MTYQPRRAIVTASDSGIGRATAVALAQAGMDVGITWHADEAGANDTAAEVRPADAKAEVARLASWPVDGGMLQMGPQAGSHITTDDWRTL